MRAFGIFVAVIMFLIGLRLVITAMQAVFSGKILVRQGFRSKWMPAPTMNDVWKLAFRDGLMGILLIGLGVALIT
jgi:hypothetical protein